MKRLIKYFKGYGTRAALGPAFKLIEALLELFVPLVIAGIIDNGILADNSAYIIKASVLLVALGAIGLGFSVTAQYFCAKCAVGFVARLKGAMFRKIQQFSYSDIDAQGTSTMITRMTADAQKVQNGVNLALRLLLRSPFVVFGAAIMAITVDPKSSLSFLVIIPLSVVVFGIMLITMPMYKRVQRGTDSLLSKTRENLVGVRVIRAFCKEDEEIDEFNRRSALLTEIQKRVGGVSALLNPLTYILINMAILCLINVGAVRVDGGELSSGQVIALYNYMSQILVELIKLANLIISISRAMASADRIADLLDAPVSERQSGVRQDGESEYAIEFKGAALRYPGASESSVRGVDLAIKRGQTLGVIGGTGSGKTSLISLIPGFYPSSEGEVLVNGVNVKDYDPAYLRSRVGIVPQKAVLFKGTIRDNMKWGNKDATDEDILRALAIAQATGVAEEKGGLDADISQGGKNLSGGQKQRLTIARALVADPDILILDDSASALDYATDAALRKSLKELSGSTTVVIVSQRASSVMNADHIIVLDDGEVVGVGTHESLLADCQIYREIYLSQFESGDAHQKEVAVNG